MSNEYVFRGIALPEHLRESLDAYIETGRPTGGFLEACICNELTLAIARADDDSLQAIPAVIGYLYNHAPTGSWGNRECMKAWLEAKRTERITVLEQLTRSIPLVKSKEQR